MNIFLAFFQSPKKYPIPAYDFWEYYIKNGIAENGYQWSECPDVDWALGLVLNNKPGLSQWKADAWGKTLSWLKKKPADLFLCYLYPGQIDMSAIGEIKRIGIPCVNFYCDHLREFKKLPVEFSVFDLNWVPEYKAIKLYQKAGYPYVNLPMPIWVDPKFRVFQKENNDQVTFIGSNDRQRQLLLEKIIHKYPGINLGIYGSGWQNGQSISQTINEPYSLIKKLGYQSDFISKNGITAYLRKLSQRRHSIPLSAEIKAKIKGPIDFDQYNGLTSGSMITVGINRYPSFQYPFSRPDSYSRLRDIEAPMLGACYLTEWTEGIDELYLPGKEIETYKNESEFVDKVKALQIDSHKRKNLKIFGQKRALGPHSIPSSLSSIVCKLHS